MSTQPLRIGGAPHCSARGVIASLALACVLVLLAGCPLRDRSTSVQSPAKTQSALAWTVNRAQATDRIGASSMEGPQATPGHRFVVLDVSVRNRDSQPQVMSEGKLIAVNGSELQTFNRPVTVFSDDYLSLQVLAPAQGLHGKIAYEVPEDVRGVLFWSPGNGSERILLNLTAPPAPQRTLANAEESQPVVAAPSIAANTEPTDDRARGEGTQAREPSPAPVPAIAKPKTPDRAVATASANQDVPRHTPKPTAEVPPAQPQQVATIVLPPPTRVVLPAPSTSVNSPVVVSTPQADSEQARRSACAGLVSRDDPAEKAGNLGFFAQSCRDYALPGSWRPQRVARRSLLERASDLIARVVVAPRVVRISDCNPSAPPAERLVCRDPGLSALDHQLAQTVARASDHVDDPGALQREQDDWRGRVRNACDTIRCLELAYGRRIAKVDALSPMHP